MASSAGLPHDAPLLSRFAHPARHACLPARRTHRQLVARRESRPPAPPTARRGRRRRVRCRLGAEPPGEPVLRRERGDQPRGLDVAQGAIRDAAGKPPLIARVSTVPVSAAPAIACRCASVAADCRVRRNAVPTWTPAAPSANAAATPRRSAMPPAAITGAPNSVDHLRHSEKCRRATAQRAAGTRRGGPPPPRRSPRSRPRLPRRARPASATVVAVPMTRMPRRWARRRDVRRGNAEDEADHGGCGIQNRVELGLEWSGRNCGRRGRARRRRPRRRGAQRLEAGPQVEVCRARPRRRWAARGSRRTDARSRRAARAIVSRMRSGVYP